MNYIWAVGKGISPGFPCKDYDDFSQAYIPHMDNEKVLLISFNVEARRSHEKD
jgi:hypothetical protein